MAKVTLNDLSKALGMNEKDPPRDFHYYGTIESADVENGTYQVSINRDTNVTVEAARLVGAGVGDTVMVTVMANGYATVTGRIGGDKDAVDAQNKAEQAANYASQAASSATSASNSAATAAQAASTASNAATAASADAQTASNAATAAVADAATAAASAQNAESSASSAQTSATTAANAATSASTSAQNAATDAAAAHDAADYALTGLSLVENVVGTLDWITSHSTLTTDTTPISGKSYYIKNQDNTFTLVEDTTGKNPTQEGWYEMDEAVANYVASHLALTNDGLYVTKDGSKYKVRIDDDSVDILDGGNEQRATFGNQNIELKGAQNETIFQANASEVWMGIPYEAYPQSSQLINLPEGISSGSNLTVYCKDARTTHIGTFKGVPVLFKAGTSETKTVTDGNVQVSVSYDADNNQVTTSGYGRLLRYAYYIDGYAPYFTLGTRSVDDDPTGYSVAMGEGIVTSGNYCIVIGKFNAVPSVSSDNENYIFIVGNGTSSVDRRNSFLVDNRGIISTHGKSGKETGIHMYNDTTGAEMFAGFGSGGSNRGVYDRTLNNFLVHTDGTNTYLRGINTKSITAKYTQNISISALGGGNATGEKTATATTRTNYYPCGIVGYELTGTGSSYCIIPKLFLDGTTITYYVRNMGSSSTSALTLTVHVLYKMYI